MNLQLSLKRKWFDMTKAGIKTEDYREINEYWMRRLFYGLDDHYIQRILEDLKEGKAIDCIGDYHLHFLKEFTQNTMTLGYPKASDTDRILILEHKGIVISEGNPEWGAEKGKLYFVIKHGKIKESCS